MSTQMRPLLNTLVRSRCHMPSPRVLLTTMTACVAAPVAAPVDSSLMPTTAPGASSAISAISAISVPVSAISLLISVCSPRACAHAVSADTRPSLSGESRTASATSAEMTSATPAGAQTPARQPRRTTAVPASRGARNAPKLCEMFHRPQYVPRSPPAYQALISFAHAGPPQP